MKNAFISGSIIGILTALWLFVMRWLGYTTLQGHMAPMVYSSIGIPLVGIYLGVRRYRMNEKENSLDFFEALFQSFKILLVSGLIVGFSGIVYISYIAKQSNLHDFSGHLLVALLVSTLICLGVALTLMNKSSKIV